MGTLDDINRKRRGYITYSTQSKDQAPVPGKKFNMIGVPGATVPPRLGVEQGLNEQEVEAEKNGPNGEVVTLADQKPQQDVTIPQREHRTTNGGAMPTRNADGERTQPVNTPAAPQQANTPKPRVPGADIEQPSVYGIRKQSRDLAARVMGWDDIMRVVNQSYPRKTAEDIEKEQRKEKRDALLATIGDGLGAFHEAYSHMRGVQPMTSGTSLRGRMSLRKEMKEREQREIDAERDRLAISLARLRQQQNTAADLSDYRRAMADYYAKQPQKWANEFQVKQQEVQNRKEHMERQDKETERKNKENEKIRDKQRQDNNANQAKNRASREGIAAKNRQAADRRQQERLNAEKNEQGKDKKASPTGGGTNSKKASPTASKK